MTNQEIADFIAEKVMLWRKWELKGYPSYWEDAEGKMQITYDDYDPTTDLNQAVQAAERVAQRLHNRIILNIWPDKPRTQYSAIVEQNPAVNSVSYADSPAHALSLAVVKAAGGDDGN